MKTKDKSSTCHSLHRNASEGIVGTLKQDNRFSVWYCIGFLPLVCRFSFRAPRRVLSFSCCCLVLVAGERRSDHRVVCLSGCWCYRRTRRGARMTTTAEGGNEERSMIVIHTRSTRTSTVVQYLNIYSKRRQSVISSAEERIQAMVATYGTRRVQYSTSNVASST